MIKTLALIFILAYSGDSKLIYNNLIYKISCTESDHGGEKLYSIHGQDSRYQYVIHPITIYSGYDVIGYMDEVLTFVQNGKKGDFKIIQGYVVKIKYKAMSFTIADKEGYGWKMIPTKMWVKMRKKIENVNN